MGIPVVGLGAGGHAKVVMEILRLDQRYELIGLLDPQPSLRGRLVLGVPVLGGDHLLEEIRSQGIKHFFVGLGSGQDPAPRCRLFESAVALGMRPVSAVHQGAFVSPSAALGEGVTIMAAAVISTHATVGRNVIVNTGAIVEHDCVIGDHVHIATGARLASTVRIGSGTHVGVGAVVRQLIHVGSGALIGAGAVVVKDVADRQVVVGNPGRPLDRGAHGQG